MKQDEIGVAWLGRQPYLPMSALQEDLVKLRSQGQIGDLLLMMEHPPTYTLGRRSEPGDLLQTPEQYARQGIAVCDTPRGGKVTYHGPGQLVIYPVVDLRQVGDQPAAVDRIDVAAFVSSLEQAMTRALARWQIKATAIEGLTGLWVSQGDPVPADATAASMAPAAASGQIRKIGSIGLRITRGISSHGLSLNVSGDLAPFDGINACGIEHCQVSSIALEAGSAPSVEEVGRAVCEELASVLSREAVGLMPNLFGPEDPGPTSVSATA